MAKVSRPRKPGILVKVLGLAGALGVVALGTAAPVRRLVNFPTRVQTTAGQDLVLPWSRWIPLSVQESGSKPVIISHTQVIRLRTPRVGHYLLRFRLFGRIPWRGVPVDVTKPIYVVPGGESVGVLAHTEGLMVTGFSSVTSLGRHPDPALEAGIERGDVITRVDGRPALSVGFFTSRIAYDGRRHQPLRLWVAGARSDRERQVEPVLSPRTGRWEIGAVVQDHTSGVGTLTFFSPGTHRFAALGHSISDGLTRRPVGLSQGGVMGADIVGLVPATDTEPGQKIGVLAGSSNVSGYTRFNGRFGIVGQLNHLPVWGPTQAMPLAFPDQVRTGPAEMITVVHGQFPESFRIQIIRAAVQNRPTVKGLLFQVTDPRLLRDTGGIIQGMSGSPIIQNGRVVGAVTHVLVNRPSMGFGCYAYWMADQPSYRG